MAYRVAVVDDSAADSQGLGCGPAGQHSGGSFFLVTKTEVRLADGTVLPLPRGAYEPLNRAIIIHT